MELTYTWKVAGLKKMETFEGNSDVVIHARWTLTGTDEEGNVGEYSGATPLRLPESGSTFTPFEELTEEQVITWIQNEVSVNGGYEDHIFQQIKKQIDSKKNPIVEISAFPWGGTVAGTTPTTTTTPGTTGPRYAEL